MPHHIIIFMIVQKRSAQPADLTCRIAIAFWQTNNDGIILLFKSVAADAAGTDVCCW